MGLRSYILLIVCLVAPLTGWGQTLPSATLEVKMDETTATLSFATDWCDPTPCDGGWYEIAVEGMCGDCGVVGAPALPTISHLVRLPAGSTVDLEEWRGTEGIATLPVGERLRPVREGWFKDMPQPALVADEELYGTKRYYRAGEPVEVENLGCMGDEQIFRITLHPFAVDHGEGRIYYYRRMEVTLSFHRTPMPQASDAMGRLLIVTRHKFEEGLREFVRWKRQEGYDVTTLYATTHQRDSVRALIRTVARPDYLLLVGDAGELQSFVASAPSLELGSHITDLPYADYTGDGLPDVCYGRWTVNNAAELSVVVQKTLRYEQFCDMDTALLRRTLLVAGQEGTQPAPITTNGQVNYLKDELRVSHPEIDTLCYYNPTSGNQLPAIVDDIGHGAGLLNYTAHCTVGGWTHPALSIGSIDTLEETQPMVYVNNCCKSNDFGGTCFGEQLLRQEGGGGVAVIGATNSTLWEEDYWWAVGPKPVLALTPTYDADRRGAFDCLAGRFPTVATCGEMLREGGVAVMASGSNYINFYWQIYCLLGDPTLRPYIGIPDSIALEVATPESGATTLMLRGTPGAWVTALQDTVFLGRCMVGEDSNAVMPLCQSIDTLSLIVTATADHLRPRIDTLAPSVGEVRLMVRDLVTSDSNVTFTLCNTGVSAVEDLAVVLLQRAADSAAGAVVEMVSQNVTLAALSQMSVTLPVTVSASGSQSLWQATLLLGDDLSLLVRHRLAGGYPTIVLHMLDSQGRVAHRLVHSSNYRLVASVEGDYDSVRLQIDDLSVADTVFPFLTADSLCSLHVRGMVYKGAWHSCDAFYLAVGNHTDDFEHGAAVFPWGHSTPVAWVLDSTESHSGHFSLRSGAVAKGESSTLDIDVVLDDRDTVAFWVKTEGSSSDKFTFYIDGNYYLPEAWGNYGWNRRSYSLSAGHHRLAWRFRRGSDDGSGRAWIDDVQLPQSRWAVRPGSLCSSESLAVDHSITPHLSLRVYPNPARQELFVESDVQGVLAVYDAYGRLVIQQAHRGSSRIDVAAWRAGFYLVTLTEGTSYATQKILVER